MIITDRSQILRLVVLYDRIAAIGRAMQEVKQIREQAGRDGQANKEGTPAPSASLPEGRSNER